MKKVLVTGACGFVGSHLVEYLVDKGYDVTATDLEGVSTKHIEKYIKENKIKYKTSTLKKKETLSSLVEGVEIVFHPAALFNLAVDYSELHKVNVEGTNNLCDEAAKAGVKTFINWSSSTLYGCWDGAPIAKTEKDEIIVEDLLNKYAVSKHEQEKIAHNYNDKMKVVSVRPGNIYGPRTAMGLAMPMKNLKLGLLQRPPALRGIGAYSSHVHVEDVVRAVEFLANKEETAGEIYNLAEDEAVSIKELFEIGCKILNKKMKKGYENPTMLRVSAHAFSTIAGFRNFLAKTIFSRDDKWYPLFDAESVDLMVKHHMISNKKIKALGFKFKHDIRKSIEDIIEHHQKTKWKEIPFFAKNKPVKEKKEVKHTFESLTKLNGMKKSDKKILEEIMEKGIKPDVSSMAGYEFDGYNLTPIAKLLGIKKFRKGFYSKQNGIYKGYNVEMAQNKLKDSWRYKNNENPKRFGWFEILAPHLASVSKNKIESMHTNSVLLHYGLDKSNSVTKGKMLRDFLVQVNEGDKDLYLGKAYNAVGKKLLAPSYFVIKRAEKVEF